MDIYHIWCNLKPGVSDVDFAEQARAYFEHLQTHGKVEGYRITRAKLGLRPTELREFHIMLEFQGLAQLDSAFTLVSTRAAPVEQVHHAVNSLVTDVLFALYRDFPDPGRVHGQERF